MMGGLWALLASLAWAQDPAATDASSMDASRWDLYGDAPCDPLTDKTCTSGDTGGDPTFGDPTGTPCDPKVESCTDGDTKRIIVETLDEYEDLLDKLWTFGDGFSEQLADGTVEIKGPERTDDPGRVLTVVQNPGSWPWGSITENWVVFRPEVTLREEMSLSRSVAFHGLGDMLDYYEHSQDPADYQRLTFTFEYSGQPQPDPVSRLPTAIPWFVTDVFEFQVITEDSSGWSESGALYRERFVNLFGEVGWRDVWMLWDNYKFPDGNNGATTHIVPKSGSPRTLRAFLQDWPPQARLFANLRAYPQPL